MSDLNQKMVSAAFLMGMEGQDARAGIRFDEFGQIDRPAKAAAVCLALGPDLAAPLIKQLMPQEAQRLSSLINSTRSLDRTVLISVLSEVIDSVDNMREIAFDPRKFAEKLMEKVDQEGGDSASELGRLRRHLLTRVPFAELLSSIEPVDLFPYLKEEHPQLVAIVAAMLPPTAAADLLDRFDTDMTVEIVQRLAGLGQLNKSMSEHLNSWVATTVKTHFAGPGGTEGGQTLVGAGTFGLDPVIQVLAAGSSEFDKKATAAITEKNPELAKRIRDEMFYFDDLLHVSDKDLEQIVSETPDETLVKALKGSVESLANKFFANMAARRKAQIQFQMNNLPPLRVSEIEVEQRQVVSIARRLQQQKVISLDRVASSTDGVAR